MRLIHRLTLRMALAAVLIIAVWSLVFYRAIVHEINDEIDDAFGDYAELVIDSFDKDDLIESMFEHLVALMAALLLSFGVISLFCVRSTARPLYKLLKWLDSYKPGDKNAKLENETKIREFRKLNDAAIKMTERVENYGQQQKLFISNASHEMQTPLAIGIGRLESMLEEEEISELQAQELVKVLHSLRGLSQLNRSLLMLSRIENGQYAEDKPIELYSLFCSYLPDFEEMFASKELKLICQSDGTFTVNMDMTLARMLALNLLKNAFAHSPARGSVSVCCTSDSIAVSNTADGGPLPADKIFQPFYHSAASEQSTGLGLPLARAVAKRYGLRLEYRYSHGEHVFTLH